MKAEVSVECALSSAPVQHVFHLDSSKEGVVRKKQEAGLQSRVSSSSFKTKLRGGVRG